MAKLNKDNLIAVVAAGAAGMFAPLKEAQAFQEAGFIEINESLTDANGNVAVRATQAGIDEVGEVEMKKGFQVVSFGDDVVEEANTQTRGKGREAGASKYPFADLGVKEGFFVPATDKMPEPRKSLSSSITTAHRHFSEETGEMVTKTVKTYEKDEDGKRVKGEDGKYVVASTEEVEVAETKPTRTFKMVDRDGGVLVIRTA